MARRTTVIASFITVALSFIGCSQKPCPDTNSKPAAVELLTVLPSADRFEFSNVGATFSTIW